MPREKVEISISGGPGLTWRLPFSTTELAGILQLMCAGFMAGAGSGKKDGAPDKTPAPFDNNCKVDIYGNSGLSDKILLELALVDDAQMAALNQDFLACAGPTNVLAFPADANDFYADEFCSGQSAAAAPRRQKALGWLAMSPQTMRREARLFHQDFSAYTLRLLAHGLGHLFGYDHGEAMDAACARAAQAAQQEYL